MSMGPWVSYRAGTWLIDECQIAFFMSCLMLRGWTHLFCRYFQCHLSYHQQFVWYPGYQFYAPLYGPPPLMDLDTIDINLVCFTCYF